MSYCLSTKYARKDDSDFVIAAARVIYCDWYLSDERRERAVSGPGVELTEVIPETQRWAFRQARKFAQAIALKEYCSDVGIQGVLANWFKTWDGDREPTEENAGWYAAMQAMGHGVGLDDAGGLRVELPHLEPMPIYSERQLRNRGWSPDASGKLQPPEGW